MKTIIHIPTMEYGFIEIEHNDDDSWENTYRDAIKCHDELKLSIQDKEGLNTLEWAKFRKAFMLSEGKEQNIELHEKLNKSQRWWTHQTELTLNDINKENE